MDSQVAVAVWVASRSDPVGPPLAVPVLDARGGAGLPDGVRVIGARFGSDGLLSGEA